MKQAKGFSLAELDQSENVYKVDKNQAAPVSNEEAIVLDIIGDSTSPLIQVQQKKSLLKNATRVDFAKAYQKLNSSVLFRRSVPIVEKGVFFELVGTMLAAGIPVIQAVRVFAEQTKHKYFKTVAEAISYQLEKGQSLSEVLTGYSYIFNEAEIGMIKSGEVTGRLNEVLNRLADEVTASVELRRKIRSAMIYPVIVIFFVIAALYAMLRFVIPQMSQLFESTGLELPGITKFIISASDFVVANGLLVGIGFFGTIFGIVTFAGTKLGKLLFHRLALNLPAISEFFRSINQSRFARSMSNLLNSGVSIIDAVNITAKSLTNVVYRNKVNAIAKDVAQGINISESIQDSKYFSNLTVSMISVGEKTAQLDELMRKIAEYYESKTADMAENFSKIIQPFIIAIVGSMVAAIVLAIMLPMTKLISGIDAL
jgi:type IV pilus assembly protein PilC